MHQSILFWLKNHILLRDKKSYSLTRYLTQQYKHPLSYKVLEGSVMLQLSQTTSLTDKDGVMNPRPEELSYKETFRGLQVALYTLQTIARNIYDFSSVLCITDVAEHKFTNRTGVMYKTELFLQSMQ